MTRPRLGLVLLLFVRSARLQRRRAALTVAAIAWSCLSLLLLLAFGEGLKRQMYRGNVGMGENLAVIWPGRTGRPWKGLPAGRPIHLRADDIDLLRARVSGAVAIVGEMQRSRVSLSYGGKTINARLVGTQPEYGEARNHFSQPGGRFLNHLDERHKRRVIFLGDERADELFGADENPVGRTILVHNVPYTVIGVMRKKLQTSNYSGTDQRHGVIPLSTFRMQFGYEVLRNLIVKPEEAELMPRVLAEVARVLSVKYTFDPGDTRALSVWDTVQTSRLTYNILVGVQLFLGIIGVLTLVIGGVGVANIMYAVVNERTPEIGVKMALGARRAWITGPLILEGLMYTLLGGVIGVLLSAGVIGLVGRLPSQGNQVIELLGRPVLSPAIGLATAAILGLVGVLAGYFPARRAASIDPVLTLRYE